MKQTITFSDFTDAFRDSGRENQFSYDAKRVIYDYLTMLEDDCGIEMELDVIAICCDFSEDHYSDIAQNYDIDLEDAEGDEDEELELVKKHLEYHTSVLGNVGENLVYQVY